MIPKIYANLRLRNDWLVVVITLVSTAANGLIPAVTSILVGRVFNLLQSLSTDSTLTKSDFVHELTLRSMSIAAVGGCVIPISWVSISCWMILGERQGFRIRQRLLDHYFEKELSWYDSNETLHGDFIQLNRCVEEVRASSAEASAITSQNIITIIALIGTSLYYSWSLTLIIMCSSPILAVLATLFSRKVEKFSSLENKESSNASLVLSWSLEAFQMIRLFNTKSVETSKFTKHVIKCNEYFIKSCVYTSLNASSLRFLTLCMFVQGFWFGNTQIKKGKLNAGDVITCFSSCLLLGSSLSSTLQQIVTMQKGKVAMEKIIKLTSEDIESLTISEKRSSIVSTTSSIGFAPLFCEGDICFEDVSFAYPTRPDDLVLRNITFKIPENRTTFIVGKSGSGKSTISNILLKFYKDYSGTVKVGSFDIATLDSNWLFENTTLVEQKCTLFNGSLKENLLIGTCECSEHNIKQACQFALLNNVLLNLPEGLNTVLGTGGISLSGGQQQKVALARAFIRDTQILILDEALSALDIISRDLLVEAIRQWRNNKTTIILTHEYRQIRDNDFVHLIEGGQIIESGLKADLLKHSKSRFFNLNKLQETSVKNSFVDDSSVFNTEQYEIKKRSRRPRLFLNSGTLSTYLKPQLQQRKKATSIHRKERIKPEHVEKFLRETYDDLEDQRRPPIMSLLNIMKQMNKTLEKRVYVYLGLVSSVLAGVANPLFSYTFSKLLTGIAPQDSKSGSSYYSMKWSLIVISIAAIDGIFTFLKEFLLGYCSETWIMSLRIKAITNISSKSIYWFSHQNNTSSEINSLIMNDLRDLRGLASEFLGAVTTLVCVASIGLIWALVSGWKLSLVCISLFPVFIIFSGIYGSLLQVYETEYKTSIAELETLLHEIMTSMKTIRCLQLEQHFLSSYTHTKNRVQQICTKRSIATGLGIAVTNALSLVIEAILFYYGIKLVINGEYTLSKMFETLTLLLFTIMTSVSIINQIPEISRGQRAATYIFKILNDKEYTDTPDVPNNRLPKDFKTIDDVPIIHVSNLSFSYPNTPKNKTFSALSLDILPKEIIGIVGESGSGKSTLSLLLTKLYAIPKNKIEIKGNDINDWNTGNLRQLISVVEQKPKFFDGSIQDNLMYGIKTRRTDKEILSVLKLVDMELFVEGLPDLLDTRIHTGLLSGGQAQRLSIARALLQHPEILILDECTSALDSANSLNIAQLIRNNLTNMTVILITHSEQMMNICDRLIVLKNGKIKEQGTFSDLYGKKGELFRIVANDEL